MKIIGRFREQELLHKLLKGNKSEFVAVYGRRRIGKTFLVKSFFKTFEFYHTGIANEHMKEQLQAFHRSLQLYSKKETEIPSDWFEAFELLKKIVMQSKKHKKVIFLDELPWLDTARSKFMTALEHFWNSWASSRTDILLIVCGSATSWIVRKIFDNKGGLHNRITQKIRLKPFDLNETEQFLKYKNINWNRYQIVKSYMALGGVPYYLDALQKGKSIDQCIDELYFNKDGLLFDEYKNLYSSLFENADKHISIIEALAKKKQGLTRDEIAKLSGIKTGGTLTKILEDLELSDFIRTYFPFGKNKRNTIYQLTDAYSLFYHNFLNSKKSETGSWLNSLDSPKVRSWSGYAYEMVCLLHADKIKNSLGISGVYTEESGWRTKNKSKGTQIDLILDRRDQVINLCEIKFSNDKFAISKDYLKKLMEKTSIFKQETKTKKAVFLTLITTYGLLENENKGMVQNELSMDDLFK